MQNTKAKDADGQGRCRQEEAKGQPGQPVRRPTVRRARKIHPLCRGVGG
jgi:hypothetical protein